MAAEVAISFLIRNLLDMVSEIESLSPKLREQINEAVDDISKFVTSKLVDSSTENDQQSSDGSPPLDRVRVAVDVADKILLEALKSHKGHLPKIRALVRFKSLWIRARPTEKMARHFITSVKELCADPSPIQHLPRNGAPITDDNPSSSNAHQGNVLRNVKIESNIMGREVEVKELLARLTVKDGDPDALRLRIVSVVGEEAIGKTVLVRSVYNRIDIYNGFHCRVWVYIPEVYTLKDLLVKILKQTPQRELRDLEHEKEENLKEILHKSLMELRYLIVFDNFHKAEDMDKLMILLADSMNGSRVIVTTRDPEIPSIIDPWASPLKLNALDAEESKLLLGECGSVAEDPRLTARILSKCNGSPPRILLLGGLAAASADSSPVMVDQCADDPTLLDIVSLSYRKLPYQFKPCLLYLCLFPKESEISTRRLFQLWLAEGLVKACKAMECFEELVSRKLVYVVRCRKLSGRPKSCRLPGFLHDCLCKTAMPLGLIQNHSETNGAYHSQETKVVSVCSWIVKYQDHNYHQIPQQPTGRENQQNGDIQIQRLRSYVSFETRKHRTRSREVEELLRPLISKGDCGLLRVLDLEGVYKPLLPDGIGNVLLNLRYLGLRWTVLDSIPNSVGNMSRLETLDLKHTNVRNLPSSILKVESLQHLYMNDVCLDKCTSGRKPSPKYLSNLQTLWGLYIGAANSPMLDVFSISTKLEKLGLTCNSPVVEEATKCIMKLTMLRSLKLRSTDFFGQPSDLNLSDIKGLNSLSDLYLIGGLSGQESLNLLPQHLKILTLSMSGLAYDPMEVLGNIESLEILNLFAGSYTGQELNCDSGSFRGLRVLKLWKLEELKKASVDKTALCRLEELEIKRCGLLTSINSLDHIKSLKQISLIEVKEELATSIRGRLPQGVFIKEKQLVAASSSSSSSSSSAQATEIVTEDEIIIDPPSQPLSYIFLIEKTSSSTAN